MKDIQKELEGAMANFEIAIRSYYQGSMTQYQHKKLQKARDSFYAKLEALIAKEVAKKDKEIRKLRLKVLMADRAARIEEAQQALQTMSQLEGRVISVVSSQHDRLKALQEGDKDA